MAGGRAAFWRCMAPRSPRNATGSPARSAASFLAPCAGVARSLAWGLDVPAIGVHHMEGHLLAPLIEDDAPQPPFSAGTLNGAGPNVLRAALAILAPLMERSRETARDLGERKR